MAHDDPKMDPARIRKSVLDAVSSPSYRPLSVRDLARGLRVPDGEAAGARRVVRDMIRDGVLARTSGRRVVAAGPSGARVGVLERRPDGRAVVAPDDGSAPVDVGERDLGGAHEGDVVAVRVTTPARGRGRARGTVVDVLARGEGGVIGVVARRGRNWEIRPFDADGDVVRIAPSGRAGAREGDVVRYETVPTRGRSEAVRVVETVGPLDAPGIDVEVVCRRHGLRVEFPDDVAAEADALGAAVPRDEAGRRERFDDPAPVTIDGENARDFDDAIAVRSLGRQGWRLYVHIADVAWFVRPGSALDREALARGTSTYFPTRVVPMLPPALSENLCSLRPGEDRLVQSLVMDIGRSGRVRKHRLADGVIRSRARLTYDQVARVLDGTAGGDVPEPVLAMLREAGRLCDALDAARAARGSVDFDLPAPLIEVDPDGYMTGATIKPRNRAHRMIEAFMLIANETVAHRLENRDLPCLYRIHELPDPVKIETLQGFAGKFGIEWNVDPDGVEPSDVQRLLDAVEGRPEYPVVAQVALRSMKQARYAVDNVGHFGLAAPSYAHFTSPIRRYPDLVVHRLARASRRGGRRDDPATEPLPEVAASCSSLERNAEGAERELLLWKKIAFMRDRVGETFEGIVTGVARFGLFVQLSDSLLEGLVRVDRLGPQWFDFDERHLELRSREGGVRYALGDRLKVRIDRVDVPLRRVELSLEGVEDGERAERAGKGGRRRRNAPRPRRRRPAGRRRR